MYVNICYSACNILYFNFFMQSTEGESKPPKPKAIVDSNDGIV